MDLSNCTRYSFHFACRQAPGAIKIRAAAAGISLLTAVSLLCGCSSTGSMYTPDSDEGSTYESGEVFEDYEVPGGDNAAAGLTQASGLGSTNVEAEAEASEAIAHRQRRKVRRRNLANVPPVANEEEEEPRERESSLSGTGSDLFEARTVDYYYGFSLEGTEYRLPTSASGFFDSGWKILQPNGGAENAVSNTIPPLSYEFYTAVPAWEDEQNYGDSYYTDASQKSVRLCIANFEETDKAPYDCTICGISAGTDNQVAFNCTFGTGIGGSLSALTGAFGTDSSIYSVTDFEDGSKTVNYHFSNGLFEDQEIRVLAEPESKDLAELLTLQTSNDGDTITYMAMYYFRLPEQGEPEEE